MTTSSKVVMTLVRSAVFPAPAACSGFILWSLVHSGRRGIRTPCDSPRVSRGRERSGAESGTRLARRGWRSGHAGRHGARGGRDRLRAGWARPRAHGATWRLRGRAARGQQAGRGRGHGSSLAQDTCSWPDGGAGEGE
jgi:hypothetical protein